MTSRRTLLSTAAWSVPVIALAVAAPAAAASTTTPIPTSCTKIKHAGQHGHQWLGVYSDGSTVTLSNSEAMSGEFGKLCRNA